MYTGLEKVVKPKQITITVDLTREVFDNLPSVLGKAVDEIVSRPLVAGVAGNIGHDGQTVGLWTTK
jgi:hypothetical protein